MAGKSLRDRLKALFEARRSRLLAEAERLEADYLTRYDPRSPTRPDLMTEPPVAGKIPDGQKAGGSAPE